MKKMFVRIILTLVLCLSLLPAALAADGQSELVSGELYQMDILSFRSAANGTVDLKSSNEVEWIDRLDFGGETWQREFYDRLVEAADFDGVDDFLIGNQYFTAGAEYYYNFNFSNGSTKNFNGVVAHQIYSNTELSRNTLNYIYNCIFAVCNAFNCDHPEVFWLNGLTEVQTIINRSPAGEYTYTVYYVLKGYEGFNAGFDVREAQFSSEAAITSAIRAQENAVASILNTADTSSPYTAVKSFSNWLTKNNQYNTTASKNYPASSDWGLTALLGRTGVNGPVCEGYARAFKVLCDACDIPCVLVCGNANGGPHMWNNVQMADGKWYCVDITWNDPSVVGERDGVAVSGKENTTYLLVGTNTTIDNKTFAASHQVTNKLSSSSDGVYFLNGPALSKTAYTPPSSVTVTTLPDASGTYAPDLTLSNVVLTGGRVTAPNGAILNGTWTWAQPNTMLYAGTTVCKAIFTPAATGYSGITANVNVVIAAAKQTLTNAYSSLAEPYTTYAGIGVELKDMVSSHVNAIPVFYVSDGAARVDGTVLHALEAGPVTVRAQFPAVDLNGDGIAEYSANQTLLYTNFTTVPMFRMYDPSCGEHFYTGSEVERDILIGEGWNYEGVGFNFPAVGDPVYRLYNPVTGDHLYTMDEDEVFLRMLNGWNKEGVAFNSASTDQVPQHRLWNPNATRGAWHFTSSIAECASLLAVGWQYQGIGWYSARK